MATHRFRTQADVDHFYEQRSGYFLNHYRSPRRNGLMCLHEAGCAYYEANPPSIGYTKTHCDTPADVRADLGTEGVGWYSCPGCNPHLSIGRDETPRGTRDQGRARPAAAVARLASAEIPNLPGSVDARFRAAVAAVESRFSSKRELLDDSETVARLREWLPDVPWTGTGVTDDEWFFCTTLYGEMTIDGQRTHVRNFFRPLFVEHAARDIRNFTPSLGGYKGLRSAWMKARLCRMGELLRSRGRTMSQYADELRELESRATPQDPTPALDRIIHDHQATSRKTLSVFVRDCVGGNCFPIDTRVQSYLDQYALPADERQLVSLSLTERRNPRILARMFFEAGGIQPYHSVHH